MTDPILAHLPTPLERADRLGIDLRPDRIPFSRWGEVADPAGANRQLLDPSAS